MIPEKELMGASTSLLVLAALHHSPSYGYELVKRLNAESDRDAAPFQWQEGTIYPILHRLQNDALIRAQWQDADAIPHLKGPRRRKYYYITAKGRRALTDAAAQWNALHALVTRLTGAAHGKPHAKPAL